MCRNKGCTRTVEKVKEISICGLNVYGLKSKINNDVFEDYIASFDVVCLSETKCKGDVSISGFECYGMKHNVKKHPYPGVHGIRVYVSERFIGCIEKVYMELQCESVLWLRVNGELLLGAVYIPHEASKYFYNEIYDDLADDVCKLVAKYALPVILIGDFNSRIGRMRDVIPCDSDERTPPEACVQSYMSTPSEISLERSTSDNTVNNNGRKLVEFCQCGDLVIVNGRVGEDKNVGAATCADASIIDYVICSSQIYSKISDFKVDLFDPLLSDKHKPIVVRVLMNETSQNTRSVCFKENEAEAKSTTMKCRWNPEKQEQYESAYDSLKIMDLKTKLGLVKNENVNQDEMDSLVFNLSEIILEPARKTGMLTCVIPHQSHRVKQPILKNKPWFNEQCKQSKKEYVKYKKSLHRESTEEEKIHLKILAKKHKKVIKRAKCIYEGNLHTQLRTLKSNNPREYWKIINEKKDDNIGNISLDTFEDYFCNIYKNSSESTDINDVRQSISIEPESETVRTVHNVNNLFNSTFTSIEIKKHIKNLKNGKSPGIDNILNEFLKHCPNTLVDVFTELFNLILRTAVIPSDWTIGVVKPLYKHKGSSDVVDNYRGITLLSCLGKLFTSLLNTRLYNYLTTEGILGNEQAGFRKDYSTLDHILTLHILSNFYINNGKQLFCAFIDYKKAFDFIDRTLLWLKMLNSNINGKVLNVIKSMYKDAKSCVKVNNCLSKFFPCNIGVRQGENLSPLLFAIFLNDFKTHVSSNFPGLTFIGDSVTNNLSTNDINVYLRLYCLLYADDTVVLAETAPQLQEALYAVHEYCDRWGLQVNVDKTKVLIFSKGKVRRFKSFKFGNKDIEVVYDYVYLGTTFNYNGSFYKAKDKQIAQAKRATFGLLDKIIKFNLPLDVCIDLYEKLIVPVMLYGCEVWGFENNRQLNITCNNYMRRLLGVNKSTPLCMVYGELGATLIEEYINNRIINFWFRIATGDDNKITTILYRFIKHLYDQNIYQSPWLKNVNNLLNSSGMSNIFIRPKCVNGTWLKEAYKLRCSDIYKQKWKEETHNNLACLNYRIMTENKCTQSYLLKLPFRYYRVLCKFKCANHNLPVVRGRYNNIRIEDRICTQCNTNDVGDEFHYLFKCPYFHNLRKLYLKPYYYVFPSTYKMTKLFQNENYNVLLNLAKFVIEITKCFV